MTVVLQLLSYGLRVVDAVLVWVVKILLAFMVGLIGAQVVMRNVVGSSIKWAEEVALIAMVWVTFLTLAIGVRGDIHIRIDMFVNWLPRGGRRALEYVLNAFLLFSSLVMMVYGWELSRFALRSTLAATRLPTAVVYGVVPVCGFICSLQFLYWLLGGKPSETAENYISGARYVAD